MAEKYQNKYRITSARLKNWDYASCATYFITICTANREHFLGQIIGGKMNLSVLGSVVEQEWIKTIEIRPDMNLSLGDYVVMPNHFHGIIFIGANEFNTNGNSPVIGNYCSDAMHGVATINGVFTKNKNTFGPQSKNLASIMRGFKSAVTTFARKNDLPFDWQPRFHDHIIRNEIEYNRISNYIINNPSKWNEDKFNGK